MSTIRFWLRKDKADKNGLMPIEMVYQIPQSLVRGTGSTRSYFRIKKQKLLPANWNEESNPASARYISANAAKKNFPGIPYGLFLESEQVNLINGTILGIINKIATIENKYEYEGDSYDTDMVVDQLKEAKDLLLAKKKPITDLLEFIDTCIANNSKSKVKGSLSVYKSLKAHLEGYEKKANIIVTFEGIDHDFMEGFRNYLYSLTKKDKDGQQVKMLNNITVAKILSTLKTFLNYAREKEIEVSTKYQSFKIKRDNPEEVIALTIDEYRILRDLNLDSRLAWDQVRDVFCFSCNTGLRFSDLKQMKWEHIIGNNIELTAEKTKQKGKIPITPDAMAILNKYAGAVTPLPVISNQKSNEHIGKICEFAGFSNKLEIVRKFGNQSVKKLYSKYELIGMHCGRKTFATISLEKQMRPEIVMKIGGWKSYASFKRYINITDESAMEAMTRAYSIEDGTDKKKKNKPKAV